MGEKTAVKLLDQFRTLAEVYEHLGEVTGVARKKRGRAGERIYVV